jgi:hypothetical protein
MINFPAVLKKLVEPDAISRVVPEYALPIVLVLESAIIEVYTSFCAGYLVF